MMKESKQPLSKAIGEWDNGSPDFNKVQKTIEIVKKAFNSHPTYKSMIAKGTLQLNRRGSTKKNSSNILSDDIDMHALFMGQIDLCKERKNVRTMLEGYFSKKYIVCHSKSIEILPHNDRLKVDLIVCRNDEQSIICWNSKTGKEEQFYPTIDQEKIGKRNDETNGAFLRMVRAFKSLRTKVSKSSDAEYDISSHMIECLLYLVKTRTFRKNRSEDTEESTRKLFLAVEQSVRSKLKNIVNNNDISLYKEVNGIKPLFQTKSQAERTLDFWNEQHKYLATRYTFEE